MKKASKFVMTSFLGASLALSPITENVMNVLEAKHAVTAEAATTHKKFKDVPSDSFAYGAINDLTQRGIIHGYKDGTFKPGGTVTRGQFAAFLVRYLNLSDADSKFKDLPKSAALYKDVSKAAKAGIIKGDTKGYVKAHEKVSRADIAVMIDRAMQLKGKFDEKVELDFKDKNSIPPYAMESVKKMTRYGIIKGKGNHTFAPADFADRAVSAEFIYRMVNIMEGKTEVPSKPPVTDDDYFKWSYEKMKQEVGTHVFQIRDEFTGKIVTVDVVKRMWEDYQLPGSKLPHPKEVVQQEIDGFSDVRKYVALYPQLELIAYNGKALKNTPLYPKDKMQNNRQLVQLDKVIPSQPAGKGQFLIDVYSLSPDFVTYRTEDLKFGDLKEKPKNLGKDYFVNIEELFANATGVKVAKDGSELTYENNKVVLTTGKKAMMVNGQEQSLSIAPTFKNGAYYAPAREVAEALGLSARKVISGIGYGTGSERGYKLEIANYPLELQKGVWE
ncbi:S-layer homology domain-containing protein [Pseudobacillus badius]|uniref:S-layer homology domain-containing protein n=1 Tax=Bacillus badius TaxID=1455 RepID=UPI001CC0F6DF|nr:S-layer homology domain-containing protein [Bacillus badius]UAT32439.1 S-layer homology domain-containing protein [Bacillus badius]GLY12724.1 hypothetical protein Bbad01_39400 [Bacillus badius]